MAAPFNVKPSGGRIHEDKLIKSQGATYAVRYVGCQEVKVSMKMLDLKMRSSVAKECINQVCEAAGLKTANRKRKLDKTVAKSIAPQPNMTNAGLNVNVRISSVSLTLISLETNQVIAEHEMPRISFACCGDNDTLDFVSFIAKGADDLRSCYVLECGGGMAKDVILTIGQAFELRFKQFNNNKTGFMNAAVPMLQPAASGGDADKDYYNDLPGKVPPDVGPPPVPPLPTLVPPFTTLPHVQSPNLIDLNADILHEALHDYVNDSVVSPRERDVFDMQPFTQPSTLTRTFNRATESDHLAQLQNEAWFHGPITRAEAECLLLRDGDFLVRESTNTPGQFVLSGMQDSNKKHLLLIDPEGIVRTKDRMFNSVNHLIQYHYENALPIISAESALVLRTKVVR